MFAEDVVICSEKLKSWICIGEKIMKVNKIKTDCMCVNERQDNGTVRMQGEKVAAKVDDFK